MKKNSKKLSKIFTVLLLSFSIGGSIFATSHRDFNRLTPGISIPIEIDTRTKAGGGVIFNNELKTHIDALLTFSNKLGILFGQTLQTGETPQTSNNGPGFRAREAYNLREQDETGQAQRLSDISEAIGCKKITKTGSGNSIFIPHKTGAELASFYNSFYLQSDYALGSQKTINIAECCTISTFNELNFGDTLNT